MLSFKAIAPLWERSSKLTCNWDHVAMITEHPSTSGAGHSTSCLLWMAPHNPTCSRKGCWSVSLLILVELLWNSRRDIMILSSQLIDSVFSENSRRMWMSCVYASVSIRTSWSIDEFTQVDWQAISGPARPHMLKVMQALTHVQAPCCQAL